MSLRTAAVVLCASLMATFSSIASTRATYEVASELQALSFKVWVDGKQVMDPSVGMPLAGRAEVSVGASENSGYTLGVSVLGAAQPAPQLPVKLHLELWRGSSRDGVQLLDEVMEVGVNGPSDAPPSVEAISTRNVRSERVRVELVSFEMPRAHGEKRL
jgi:hypothetical protein